MTVNRFWQMFFGTGLVKTAEDFGSQGELPSHPSCSTGSPSSSSRDGGWDVEGVRAAARHVGARTASRRRSRRELLAKDPENRLLARGPRFRLQAEFIRDQALAVERPARPPHRRPERLPLPAGRACGKS